MKSVDRGGGSVEDRIYEQRRNPRLVWLDSVFALFVCVVAPLVFLVELPGGIGLLLLVAGLFTFLRSKVSPKYVTRRLVDTVPSHSTQAPWEPFEKKLTRPVRVQKHVVREVGKTRGGSLRRKIQRQHGFAVSEEQAGSHQGRDGP